MYQEQGAKQLSVQLLHDDVSLESSIHCGVFCTLFHETCV
jgi:hypothetical protein